MIFFVIYDLITVMWIRIREITKKIFFKKFPMKIVMLQKITYFALYELIIYVR